MTQISRSPLVPIAPSVPLCGTGTVPHISAQSRNEDRIKISIRSVQALTNATN